MKAKAGKRWNMRFLAELSQVRAVRIGTIHFLPLLIINSCKILWWVNVISSFLYWYLFISSVGVTKCWWCWSLSRVVGDVEQSSLEVSVQERSRKLLLEVIGDSNKIAWNLVTWREMVLGVKLIAFSHDRTSFSGKFFLKAL